MVSEQACKVAQNRAPQGETAQEGGGRGWTRWWGSCRGGDQGGGGWGGGGWGRGGKCGWGWQWRW